MSRSPRRTATVRCKRHARGDGAASRVGGAPVPRNHGRTRDRLLPASGPGKRKKAKNRSEGEVVSCQRESSYGLALMSGWGRENAVRLQPSTITSACFAPTPFIFSTTSLIRRYPPFWKSPSVGYITFAMSFAVLTVATCPEK